jgi:hypothetical protein
MIGSTPDSETTTTQKTTTRVLYDRDAVYVGIEFELIPQAFPTTGEPRYMGMGPQPGQYLFGRLAATSVSATMRGTYSFTPRLSVQGYARKPGFQSPYLKSFVVRARQSPALHQGRPAFVRPPDGSGMDPSRLKKEDISRAGGGHPRPKTSSREACAQQSSLLGGEPTKGHEGPEWPVAGMAGMARGRNGRNGQRPEWPVAGMAGMASGRNGRNGQRPEGAEWPVA